MLPPGQTDELFLPDREVLPLRVYDHLELFGLASDLLLEVGALQGGPQGGVGVLVERVKVVPEMEDMEPFGIHNKKEQSSLRSLLSTQGKNVDTNVIS